MTEFRPGELFAYVRDNDTELTAIELGQVARKVSEDVYACYYSTGDTAARTNVRNMRKFANSGWSHVERAGEDDMCEWEPNLVLDALRCSKCGYELPAGVSLSKTKRCGGCGRWLR